jgi:hypothetical protein
MRASIHPAIKIIFAVQIRTLQRKDFSEILVLYYNSIAYKTRILGSAL